MVSIVIVSHSPDLAKGVHALASQMSQGKVKIAVAAGVDDPDNPIGTDAIAVMMAIEEVYTPQGVLVLVDMGSAILSTDTALELIDSEQAANVHVCAAPLIEGCMSACVAAAAGMSLEEVSGEAHNALVAKYTLLEQNAHLPGKAGLQNDELPALSTAEEEMAFEWQVKNPHGIHARPASAIVGAVSSYDAQIWLECHGKRVSARSINSIALLGVEQGDSLTCVASGNEAQQALQAFSSLAQNHFNESIEKTDHQTAVLPVQTRKAQVSRHQDGRLNAIGASEGIAIAPVWHYKATMPKARERDYLGYGREWALFSEASGAALQTLAELAEQTAQKGSQSESDIFTAHSQILTDPELVDTIRQRLKEAVNVEIAWSQLIEKTAQAYKDSSSDYMQARANDVYDVGCRVMGLLTGEGEQPIELTEPVILVATDLSPSDTARLDPAMVKGIILEQGGSTSHSAILARSLGIPAVVGLSGITTQSQEGQTAVVRGSSGEVWLTPTAQRLEKARREQDEFDSQGEQARMKAMEKACTLDGRAVEINANLSSLEDAGQALALGAEGVGLVRSEFLFMDSEQPPSEQSQFETYCQIAQALGDKPVIIRTLDIGGDKPLTYLQQGEEENPFLGCRGLRLCLQNVDVFRLQLNALLRARAKCSNLQVMFPMVATMEELNQAKYLLNSCYEALQHSGIPAVMPKIGIMIEVPAAVANARQLAEEVSFFSIGTNDLTQYVMAADRGNDRVSYLVSAAQPAVLRMIEQTAQAAHEAGISVGICGEMAGDPKLTEVLLGMGVNELSMSPIRIAAVKQAVRATESKSARMQAQEVLGASTLKQVMALL
ncbi:phosphoenolpyruvate--protein phosphotransferase [Photobacterium alginatilyticum]|uniref:Phosphoenolpyruvate--protein phosphotransferase n=1 Tax=Photobacterium alginatilyticum TaxID=1775171 RepID=A0ABW9YFI8_9GAMM|nr:phosphoenolpyruvate--protein phosphotransferase [Photobacterium alginatilyticum]NBI52531.1 phosphoenolpyruvate--protein phosphotransferase [Photobacterium alginatilyticum]